MNTKNVWTITTKDIGLFIRKRLILLSALILPLLAIMPLLTHAGLPNTADGPVHLMRQVELNQAWQQGNFYPRWGTDLALGHGMPIFSYAPPLLYQLTSLQNKNLIGVANCRKPVGDHNGSSTNSNAFH